ncbi:2-methylaconitate cis-trans isomerase PrpF family protein [Piscirickettsia salmonis]|uniref:2-methylaconitate cis-trans isomerase PrpF family protein n=1 Tax=Piscirickettsia salmonis TaxID=1238 RepID=UPI0002FA8573|nr:PrpF domain-containing protein [Piscirickettsia salmonis]APS59093.1 3-methylitaconate isomerase [Piscirickettsia salmonis]ERL60635.1 3-methylitaconate isomerase [Piscirickettsia salmonis LF-89 = ATCC VR-1361]PEQ16284.1 3-methylitaconate isomerase [Piscirickettsia salmonis]QGN79230.1 3-methylitaconate isomerase [Piscirickettsia salmonis]QGN82821.1 3-methylitaconate isomerase [Piscirickettsia salmonis]
MKEEKILQSVPVSIVRGGTSKAIFIEEKNLPRDHNERDNLILSIFGSPDVRQIDGLGGADVLTSKLGIIGASTRTDADIDYVFGQVSIDKPMIDYRGNCGNISAAVGIFAINKGYIHIKKNEEISTVRIHMKNTGRILTVFIPVYNSFCCIEGDYSIDGVPGTGPKIDMDWADCGGDTTGNLLPTGNVRDIIKVNGQIFDVSIVDAGNLVVFINADALGIIGNEYPENIYSNRDLMNIIEIIRGKAAEKIGLIDDFEKSIDMSPYIPFVSIVSPSSHFISLNGNNFLKNNSDITSRLIFMQNVHKAHPVSATIALSVASLIPGSVVNSQLIKSKNFLRISHPSGIISIETCLKKVNNQFKLKKSLISRTARIILDGTVYISSNTMKQKALLRKI